MSTARQILDWQGQEASELARTLADLPRGRYVLVPEDELAMDDVELSPDDESAAEDGLDDIERGATLPWDQARTGLVATIAAARASRGR